MNNVGEVVWKKCYGGTNNEYASTIVQTADGGYIFGGHTNSNDGDVINGAQSVLDDHNWVVKINGLGIIEWQKYLPISQTGSEIKSIIKVSNNNYVIAGNCYAGLGNFSYGDIYITQIDELGNPQLPEPIIIGGGYHDYVNTIKQNSDGSFILAGVTYSVDNNLSLDFTSNHHAGPFGVGTGDAWVVKLNANFEIEWHKLLGGSNNDEFFSIEDTEDGYIFCGFTESNNGDISTNQGDSDFWIVKLNSLGNLQSQKTYGGNYVDYATCVLKSTDGNYIISGYSNSDSGDITNPLGAADYWIIKINASGDILWQKNIGGASTDASYSMDKTTDDGYILVGFSESDTIDANFNNGYRDYWVVKLGSETLNTTTFTTRDLIIYPNPANSFLNIKLPNENFYNITITDILGKTVKNQKNSNTIIDTENLSNGSYNIQVNTGTAIYKSKFIKQ